MVDIVVTIILAKQVIQHAMSIILNQMQTRNEKVKVVKAKTRSIEARTLVEITVAASKEEAYSGSKGSTCTRKTQSSNSSKLHKRHITLVHDTKQHPSSRENKQNLKLCSVKWVCTQT